MKQILRFLPRPQHFQPKTWVLLLTILGLAVRLYQLDQVPNVFNPDEAALAYNAVLLRETGRDEWGRTWPLALQSFGDQKLIGYPVLLIASFMAFGYQDWAVRLPAALAGTALIPLSYLLLKTLKFRFSSSLFLAFMVTVSPVWVFYSRVAFEAIVALAYVLTSLWLLWRPVSGKRRVLADVVAVLIYLFAGLTYNTPLFILPAVIVLTVIWRLVQSDTKQKSQVIPFGLLMLAVGAFLVWQLSAVAAQKSQVTIFNTPEIQLQQQEFRQSLPSLAQKVMGNRYLYWLGLMVGNYFKGFGPQFLLSNTYGHPWHAAPGTGYFYITTYIFALVGLLWTIANIVKSSIKGWKRNKLRELLPSLMLIGLLMAGFLPAAVTIDAPHATRSLLAFWSLHALAAVAVTRLAQWLSHKAFDSSKVSYAGLILAVATLVLIETGGYLNHYFTRFSHAPTLMPGYRDILVESTQRYPNRPIAVVDGRGFQYVLTAWYLHFTPQYFMETVVKQQPDTVGLRYGEQVGNFHFIKKPEDRRATEEIVIEWNEAQELWLMQTY